MAWMLYETKAAEIIGYLLRLYALEPTPALEALIIQIKITTNMNRGKEL